MLTHPRARLSPGVKAAAAAVGQLPSVDRIPASAAYSASVDSREARAERRSSSDVAKATTTTRLMMAIEKITAINTKPSLFPVDGLICRSEERRVGKECRYG